MPVDYDPYSDAAMRNPAELYRQMRAEGAPHYIEKYNAWALTRFEDVWAASTVHEKNLDYGFGQTPGQLLLGEPAPPTFMTMNAPEHRQWRALVRKDYTPEGVKAQHARLRALIREILDPLLARGEMDVYGDLANRILCINAGYNLGLHRDDAETVRALIDDMLHREPGQVGMVSPRNQAAAQQLFGHLFQHVGQLRADPSRADMHAKIFLEAEIDGRRLSDEEVVAYLFSLLVTGSETTPMATAGAFYYLARNPEQKRQLLADPSLAMKAFLETCRFDQPTNMLARRARADFNLGDTEIKAGQNLLFIYASANRDEAEFDRPDVYDMHRVVKRDLNFGAGGHKCLGMHLAMAVGVMIIEELAKAIDDYELDEAACQRAYGEHLQGFLRVPIRFRLRPRGLESGA